MQKSKEENDTMQVNSSGFWIRTADPGFVGVAPGRGVMVWPPYNRIRVNDQNARCGTDSRKWEATHTVSVCQKVSTIAHFPLPTTLWYQSHASGLMGSPTVPRTCRDSRLYL